MDAKLEALKDLASLSRDVTFAQEFINLDGISLLTQMVESGTERYQKLQKIMKPCFGDMLSFTLTAFVELMDHGIVSWDTFSVAFIKKIASFVNKSAMDVSILQRSLAILESMVLNSHDLYQKVAQEITIGQLIPHLQGSDQEIQTYTIAVINALFLKAPDERRQHVIRAQRAINNEMAHQLYVLQVLTFNLLEDRMMTKMDPQDQAQRDIIFELRRIAFDAESEPNNSSGSMEKRKSMYTRDYKKLGFINHVNPAMDFTQTPPGMLALDNMLYFAKHHQDAYIRWCEELCRITGINPSVLIFSVSDCCVQFTFPVSDGIDEGHSLLLTQSGQEPRKDTESPGNPTVGRAEELTKGTGDLDSELIPNVHKRKGSPKGRYYPGDTGVVQATNAKAEILEEHGSSCGIQIVLENSSREDKHECPFGRSSIELTKMLCEILKVGELHLPSVTYVVDCPFYPDSLNAVRGRTAVCENPLTDVEVVLSRSEFTPLGSLREYINAENPEEPRSQLNYSPGSSAIGVNGQNWLGPNKRVTDEFFGRTGEGNANLNIILEEKQKSFEVIENNRKLV
ncbi:hypothetical protein CB1_001541015 [Camelus ferus]|nr:hypothetical protein CB1_001541015 [Camelus ferus]